MGCKVSNCSTIRKMWLDRFKMAISIAYLFKNVAVEPFRGQLLKKTTVEKQCYRHTTLEFLIFNHPTYL